MLNSGRWKYISKNTSALEKKDCKYKAQLRPTVIQSWRSLTTCWSRSSRGRRWAHKVSHKINIHNSRCACDTPPWTIYLPTTEDHGHVHWDEHHDKMIAYKGPNTATLHGFITAATQTNEQAAITHILVLCIPVISMERLLSVNYNVVIDLESSNWCACQPLTGLLTWRAVDEAP